jgi:hypothetical protein
MKQHQLSLVFFSRTHPRPASFFFLFETERGWNQKRQRTLLYMRRHTDPTRLRSPVPRRRGGVKYCSRPTAIQYTCVIKRFAAAARTALVLSTNRAQVIPIIINAGRRRVG